MESCRFQVVKIQSSSIIYSKYGSKESYLLKGTITSDALAASV